MGSLLSILFGSSTTTFVLTATDALSPTGVEGADPLALPSSPEEEVVVRVLELQPTWAATLTSSEILP